MIRNILNYEIDWDDLCEVASEEAADLVSRLLIEDPNERLGSAGADEVCCRRYFCLPTPTNILIIIKIRLNPMFSLKGLIGKLFSTTRRRSLPYLFLLLPPLLIPIILMKRGRGRLET